MSGDTDRYDEDPALKSRAAKLLGKTISAVKIVETGNQAVVTLLFDDGSSAEIGAHGSLHDEAYLVFEVAP